MPPPLLSSLQDQRLPRLLSGPEDGRTAGRR
uniref:Uncharacterized protein n=1 Tax=Arundo donax TaxID=35708 RepID=A0A0A9CGP0_ARUDO